MVITMFGMLKLLGLSWTVLGLLIFISIPLTILIVYLDIKYVLPKYQKYLWGKNPVVKQLLRRSK